MLVAGTGAMLTMIKKEYPDMEAFGIDLSDK
jgi:ubiquinone/menaquinone biosynthesis C-methylase UbiE